jgi:hypothetical protein
MEWLQLVYKVPAEPSRKRTYIWRQVRGLGAVYLQDACCVLPRTEAAEQALRQVAEKVREFGGEAMLSVLGPAEPGWEERLVARLNRARDEEYEELLDTTERLEEEIARESRKDKFTFAALEEIEDEYDRLERWLERVRARDPFSAPGGQNTDARLAQARAKLEAFAEQVQRRERIDAGANAAVAPGDAAAERSSVPTVPERPDVGGGDPSDGATSD